MSSRADHVRIFHQVCLFARVENAEDATDVVCRVAEEASAEQQRHLSLKNTTSYNVL